MLLRTYEAAHDEEIELNSTELVLYTQRALDPFPTTFSFSIPVPPDTPQSIQTPHSSLAHTLTACLHPNDESAPIISTSITVYTRRYSPHAHTLPASPETHLLEDPTRVEVQLPRSSFTVGELIPVYVTIPPPPTSIVVDRGLRLRNMRVELIRVIRVRRGVADDVGLKSEQEEDTNMLMVGGGGVEDHVGTSNSTLGVGLSVQSPSAKSPLFPGLSYKTVIARSGASCRFHSSRSIRLRFILHPSSTIRSPTVTQSNLPGSDYGEMGCDADIGSITQTTLLHSVVFFLKMHISFLDTKEQSERTSTLTIPLSVLPPPARLPEISQTFDEAYSKKHDRPPAKTNRYDELERAAPHYCEGQAGPSMISTLAPPPFEERDAPPPFSSPTAEASTSSRLPTFLESETEVLLPDSTFTSSDNFTSMSLAVEGEGMKFGFHAEDQFDGHSEDMQRSMTPPPSMEMAAGDADLTALTEIQESSQGLALVLDQREEDMILEEQPPPPPAMDDPSDPPPSIDDSTFRRPDPLERPRSPQVLPSPLPPPPPPPYLNADVHHDQENVIRPPPYYYID